MKKYRIIMIVSLLFSLMLVGCATNNKNDVAYRNKNGMQPTRVDYPNHSGVRDVNDTNLNRNGVRDNNITDNRNTTRNVGRNNNGAVNDNNVGNNGVTNYGAVPDTRNNTGNVNNNNNINDKSRFRVADQAANKIADMREVDTANVITTDNNAYVAVKLTNGQKLTNGLEKRISNHVKSVDRDINHVYVSANPDFYNHMRGYANDIRSGKPVSGFFTEFSQTIQRVFPDRK